MVFHQLIQWIKLYNPQEILARPITQNFEVLHTITKSAEKEKRRMAHIQVHFIMSSNKVMMLSWIVLASF